MCAVAKAVNGINSRWARKIKDAIYLGCCVVLFSFLFFFYLRSVPAARSSVHSNVLCFLRRFLCFCFMSLRHVRLRYAGKVIVIYFVIDSVDGKCSYLAVEYHVMDWRPLSLCDLSIRFGTCFNFKQTNIVFSVQFFCLDNGRSPVKSSIRPVELKTGGVRITVLALSSAAGSLQTFPAVLIRPMVWWISFSFS